MPDPQHKLVKVDDSIIHFPGDMPDDDVAAVIKKFTSSPDYKKQTHTKSQMPSGIATEESEHKRLTGNVPTVTPDWNTVRKAVYKATEPTLPHQNTTPVNNTVKANVDAAWNAGANAANVGGNIAKRAGRVIFGAVEMPIQVLSILKNLSSSDDNVSQQAETNLLNLHPGAQIADRLKEAVTDWRKSPSLATENALGDVLGFFLLDKAGKVLPEEKIKQLNAEGVVLPPEAQPKTVPAKAGPTTIEGQFEKVPPKGFQPVQAAAKITKNEPPKLADVKAEAGKLVAPPKVESNTQLTVKRPSFKEPDLSTAEVVFSAQRSPDRLYRGTNGEDELQNIIASQNIASTSETANRLGKSGHQGMTFFSDHPNVATSYVHNGGYVIEVDASKVPAVGNHGAGEVATSAPTPASAITRVFRVGKDARGYHAVDVTHSILPALARPAAQAAKPQPTAPTAAPPVPTPASEPAQAKVSVPVKPETETPKAETKPVKGETKYKFGNTQADIPQDSEAGRALATARTKIDKNDLMPSTNTSDGSGLEENSHITVRYGIDGEDTAGIKAYLEKQAPFEATLGKTTAFPPSEHSDGGAPIVVNIESPELHRMENEIDAHGNFTERSFPEYKPHVTLGYVKPEAAQKYVGMSGMEGKKFTVNSVSISNKDGSIEEVPLKGTPEEYMNPSEIVSHPDYQSKPEADKQTGLVEPLTGEYDPDKAGKIVVWKNPKDGKSYVVQGFHRLDLAKRSGVDRVAVQQLPPEEVPDLLGRLQVKEWEKEIAPRVNPVDAAMNLKYNAADQSQPFYLKSEKLLAEKMKGPMPASDIQKMLLANGVKEEEMKYTGLDDFLKEKGNEKVTPQEINEFNATHDLQVQEVMKGETPGIPKDWEMRQDPATGRYQVFGHDGQPIVGSHGVPINEVSPEIALHEATHVAVRQNGSSPTKFSSWQMPGGENYRELLVTLPSVGRDATYDKLASDWKNAEKASYDYMETHRESLGDPDPVLRGLYDNVKQTKDALDTYKAQKDRESPHGVFRPNEGAFTQNHWPDNPNTMAHIRFNERTGPNGEHLLHIEELQSDWHQKGRAQGYAGDKPKYTELPEGYKVVQEGEYGRFSVYNAEGKIINKDYNEESAINGAINILNDEARGTTASPVPDAPFKKTWPELLLKRMVKYAVDNGYDGITYTPGEEQADRYDLSKQVDHIDYRRQGRDRYEVAIVDKNGEEVHLPKDDFSADELADVVGKDVAEKIVAGEGHPGGGRHTLRGLDLKVGGSGMRGFYDKIVPDALNKIAKKFGTKVEKTEISTKPNEDNDVIITGTEEDGYGVFDRADPYGPPLAEFDTTEEAKEYVKKLGEKKTVPYLPITPQMRAGVLAQPFALFKQVYKSPPASDIQLADAWRRLGDVKKELEGMPRPNDPKPTASPEEIERWKADYKAWAERAQPFLEKYKQATQQIEDLKNRGIGEIRLLPDKSRVLYLNRAGLNTLYHGMAGEARPGYTLSGVSLDPSNVKAIIGNLMIMKPPLYQELTEMMLRGMDKKGVVVSAIPRKGESLREALSTLREELNHGWQNTVADQMGNHLSPDKFAELNEAMPDGMKDHLTRNYPEITNDGSELMNRRRVREASAKMLSEAPQKLGITEDEAAAYLFQYFHALEEQHGEKALDNLLHITTLGRSIKRDYFESIGRNSGSEADQRTLGRVQEGGRQGDQGNPEEAGRRVPEGAGVAAKLEPAMKQVKNATPEEIANIEQKILASNPAYKSANSLASGSPGAAVAKGAITREEAAQYSKAKGFFNEFNDLSAPGPKPTKERIGTEEPDGRAPSVNWHREDLQDSGAISDEQLLKDYNGGKPALVYPSFIDINDMPDPVLAEEQDDEFEEEGSGYPWEDFRFSSSRGIPPMKIAITPHGDIEILDGNHRLKYWTDQGYTSFPAWVIDRRKGKISGLSEEEEDKLAAIKRAAAKLKTPAAAKQVTVRDPEGYVHTFPDEASAAKFRAAAGIK